MKISRKVTIIISLLALISCYNCHFNRPVNSLSHNQTSLSLFKIKFNLRTVNGVNRGKILLKTDSGNRAILTFLSPLNQILFRILIKRNVTLLICRKRGKYWQGSFKEIITILWGVDLKFNDFINLIKHNTIPDTRHITHSLSIDILKESFPKQIKITAPDSTLELRIRKKKISNGFNFTHSINGLRNSSLRSILH
jgi:hypothetical protein